MKTDWNELNKILHSTRIDLNEKLEPQPIAISIGNQGYHKIPFGTYGNFSCITGIGKSFKSFFKTALIAGYIGGKANNYFSNISGYETDGKLILDFDTEQSRWQVQTQARRAIKMVGAEYPLYRPYFMRHLDPSVRLSVIEHEIYRSEKPIGIVCIDGIADLITNINDPEQSNMVVGKLLEWSAEMNCHIITILHRNISKDNSKPTGWIGTTVTKKAETVVALRRQEKIEHQSTEYPVIEVHAEYTRNMPFRDFSFTLNSEILPTDASEDEGWV